MRLSTVFPILILTLLSFGCGSEDKRQNDAANGNADQAMVGGFEHVAVDDPDATKAAEFAVAEQSKKGTELKLKSVKSAESQVVAGTNFRMTLLVDEGGAEKEVKVVVYRDLKNVMSLTSWE